MKKVLVALLTLALLMVSIAAMADEPSGTVVVYSSHQSEPLNSAVNAFMAKYPGVQVEVVSLGGGEILQRVAAEAANPLCDVSWGSGVDSVDAYSEYWQEYISPEDAAIGDQYKDAEHKWYADSTIVYVNMYNKKLVAAKGVPEPTTWADLIDETWKGQIAMADPAQSGSAYVQVCALLFDNGGAENGGWDFVNKFYQNLDGKIQSSSSKIPKGVADGEYALGLTLEKFAVEYIGNEDVGWYYPAEGTAAVGEGIALVKGAPHEENGKLFIDFVLSQECQQQQSDEWNRRSVRSDVTVNDALPSIDELKVMDYDVQWAADHKAEVLETWQDIVVGDYE